MSFSTCMNILCKCIHVVKIKKFSQRSLLMTSLFKLQPLSWIINVFGYKVSVGQLTYSAILSHLNKTKSTHE